ncbi:cytidine deaminase [Candidatus Atribacteria bacterium 4572_76]|nr:MAG: cytidine deaminase [Candidatus Atribacteria bacterium 4572_76]
MSRPTWDEYFMEITELVSKRSTCLRRKVGAVIVQDKRILTTGYNGAPRGLPHCLEIGCLREIKKVASGERQELCRGLHAEQNAIVQAALHGNSGIKKIIFKEKYPDELARKMLKEAGIDEICYE